MRHEVFRTSTAMVFLAAGVVTLTGCPTSDDDAPDPPQDFELTMVALPDTQSYSAHFPEIYVDQTQWIVDQAEAEGIGFVTHLGDIVDAGTSDTQWANARAAMDLLDDAGMPYGTAMGNHDRSSGGWGGEATAEGCSAEPVYPCAGTAYIENFGPRRYADRDWYGGASPSALSNYQRLVVEGQELLFIHLVVDPWAEEIAWAQQVLDAHPDAAAAISTHRYLFDFRMTDEMPEPFPLLAARRFDYMMVTMVQGLYFEDGWIAEDVFQDFIRHNPQIYMVQCGHIDAEYYQVSDNDDGLPVHELLIDLQSLPPEGGNGYLRLLRYDIDGGQIHLQTYSPTLERYRDNGEGCEFSIDIVVAYFNAYRDEIAAIADPDELEEQIDYWSTTEEGREEFCSLLYDGGQRDSDFWIDVDFGAYRQ